MLGIVVTVGTWAETLLGGEEGVVLRGAPAQATEES